MKPDSLVSRRAILTAGVTAAASLAMQRIALGVEEPHQATQPQEKTTKKETASGGCDPLGAALAAAVSAGDAQVKLLANIGLEHEHDIYLVKVISGTNPSHIHKPTDGSKYFKIRPNHRDTTPSTEGGKNWDWYLLSCPHDPPCPLLAV